MSNFFLFKLVSIGKNISTYGIHNRLRMDITDSYKFPEGKNTIEELAVKFTLLLAALYWNEVIQTDISWTKICQLFLEINTSFQELGSNILCFFYVSRLYYFVYSKHSSVTLGIPKYVILFDSSA